MLGGAEAPPNSKFGITYLAVRKFRSANEECCGQGYDRRVQTLLQDVVAPETHQNDRSYSLRGSNCELLSHHARILRGERLHRGP